MSNCGLLQICWAATARKSRPEYCDPRRCRRFEQRRQGTRPLSAQLNRDKESTSCWISKFIRENPDAVKENIRKKFQEHKPPLVDEVIEKDAAYRECLKEVENLKAARISSARPTAPVRPAEEEVPMRPRRRLSRRRSTPTMQRSRQMQTVWQSWRPSSRAGCTHPGDPVHHPQMIDPSVPIGPDDSCNVEHSA